GREGSSPFPRTSDFSAIFPFFPCLGQFTFITNVPARFSAQLLLSFLIFTGFFEAKCVLDKLGLSKPKKLGEYLEQGFSNARHEWHP
ncbi:hypothetical protein, partial [uncultured Varibaculum sp.]|uniref:hypothetical protein n=1 Tax=uncultured Varibaculum sp. TaxID=413896 RepID=UPI002596CD47